MHTVIVLSIAFGLLIACLVGGRLTGGMPGLAVGALVFLPVWLIGAGINMYMGVKGAGYSVAEEIPFFLIVFSIPAAVSLLVWWKVH